MAVLARVNFIAQQRLDLHHLLAMESFSAFDFRSLISFLGGSDKSFVARGFEVVGKTGLSVSIRVADSFVINPLDNVASFYRGLPDDDDIVLELPAEQTNIFVEAKFTQITAAPVNTSFWNPLALSGDDVAGNEFGASANSQNIVQIEISANNVGFTEGAVKLFRAKTSASAVTDIQDARDLFFRQAIGGVTPDPSSKFPWAVGRDEPVVSGPGTGNQIDSSFRSRDSTGVLNDKGIRTMKEWMDAVMTRISELSGAPGAPWYATGLAQNVVTGLNVNTIFFDSDAGHSISPSFLSTFMWSQEGDNILRSQGTAPVEWKANYVGMEWQLGGTFVNNTPGGSRDYSEVKFESAVIPDGSSVFLLLERDVPKASGNAVSWADNSADPGNLDAAKAVSGVAGDFTGIAIGDFIRKQSEGYSRYYRVVKMSDGSSAINTANYIADASIVGLELSDVIASGAGTEPLRYFRYRYSNSDLQIEPSGLHPYQDISYYWIARRKGNLLMLRNYGIMQPGEEIPTQEDSASKSAGTADLVLEHQFDVTYDGVNYKKVGGPATMLKIYRRKRDNTVRVPGSGDNSDALLEYTISNDIAILPGQQLWVKLSDTTGGALSAGSVAGNISDDEDNTEVITNVYEVLDPEDTPLRNFDNIDVFLLARAVTLGSGPWDDKGLVFFDGTVIGFRGHYINNRMAITGDTSFYDDNVRLIQRPEEAILFIDENPANDRRIDDDVANFFYQKAAQIHGVFNYRWGVNTLHLDVADDVDWLWNLGNHTLFLGSSNSTVRVRGNLQVDGTTVSANVLNLQIDDKVISLGVGNLVNMGGGSGIEVADDTLFPIHYSSTNGQDYIDIEYSAPHGYIVGDVVGVSVTDDVGGITSGEITGSYEVVVTGVNPGDAEVISATGLRIWTSQTATSTETVTTSPTIIARTFLAPSYIRLSDSSGDLDYMTSWSFAVKGVNPVMLTPVANYQTSPTAHSVNMRATRIPYTDPDGSGIGGADTTLNFSANFTFDDSTDTLSVLGSSNIVASNLRSILNEDLTLNANGTEDILLQAGGTTHMTVRNSGAINITPVNAAPTGANNGDFYFNGVLNKLLFDDGLGYRHIDQADITGEISGYQNRTDSTFSFNDGTREFSIQPTGTHFDYYIRGTRYRVTTTKTYTIPDVTGLYFLFFDDTGELDHLTAFSPSLLTDYAYTATVYWNATTQEAEFLSDERHGLTMDGDTHTYLHQTQGTRYIDGLGVFPLVSMGGDGSADDQAQIEMTGGRIRDEDLLHTIVDAAAPAAFFEQILTPIAQIPVMYRTGASGEWVKDTATNFPLKAGTVRPQWNEFTGGSWQTSDTSADGNYIAMWIFATNDVREPIVAMMGQGEYADLSTAQSDALYELLNFGDLPFQEFKLLFRVLFSTNSNYTNSIKAVIEDITDYRKGIDTALSSSYMPSDHGNLSGLGDDDHLQYLLLAGRAGGQVVRGGINSGDNLVLRSTSDGTKGQVYVDETTASTSTTTGAFRVAGGVGIGGSTWVGQVLGVQGLFRAQSGLRFEKQVAVTTSTALTVDDCIVKVDTTANVADITITLPPSDASNLGQVLIIKDVGGQASHLNKRVFIAPNGGDTIQVDDVAPVLMDFDYFCLILVSDGAGGWMVI